MLKKIMSSQTASASANVVLTSAVGTCRQLCWWKTCSYIHAMMSTGRKSIAFMRSTHTNTVIATGVTKSRVPWKMPFTWSSTKLMSSSTKAWRLPGTPAVAPRTTSHRKPNVTTPSTTDVTSVSRCSVQKGESPSDTVRFVRW